MSKRNIVIVGNWKMNKTPAEAKKFMSELTKHIEANKANLVQGVKYGIASPSIDISTVAEHASKGMIVAAQDVRAEASGAYTGDLSVEMIKSVGANAVVLGHSERREYHSESDATINAKTKAAIAANLFPIVCIGETLEQRESNIWKDVIKTQVTGALVEVDGKDVASLVIAYEPIWAIGTGVTASADQAEEACAYVREVVKGLYSDDVASKVTVQYGGSVKPENVAELMGKENIDGALVGGASLEAESFLQLITYK